MAGLLDRRMARIRWTHSRWQQALGPVVQGAAAWRAFTRPAAGRAVLPLDYEPTLPAGGTAWPDLPPKTVQVSFTHPRTGAVESWSFVDPAKVAGPGPVTYSGYPRNGQGSHVLRDVWVGPGVDDRGDVTLPGSLFVWASDLMAANPGTTYALDGGYNLRTICQQASAWGKAQGVAYPVLVLDVAGSWYVPDFTMGYHAGVQFGPGLVELRGIVGTGPKVRIGIAPSCRPTSAIVSGSTTQLGMMRADNPLSSNYATILFADKVPHRMWFANWVGVHTDLRDPNDNAPLYWQGLKVSGNNLGSLVERIGTRGFNAGYRDFNPGETDALSWLQSANGTCRDCFFEGRSMDGVRRSTSVVGHNTAPNCRMERNTVQYGYAGMTTWWQCDGVTDVFNTTYSQGVGGGSGLNGSGMNLEETYGRIRVFYRRNIVNGKWSSTSDVDTTQNSSFWGSIMSNSRDNAIDAVFWEPWHSTPDFQGFDAKGRLAFAMPLNYNVAQDGTSKAVSHPMVYRDGAWVTGDDNVDLAALVGTSHTRTYKTPSATAGFVVSR